KKTAEILMLIFCFSGTLPAEATEHSELGCAQEVEASLPPEAARTIAELSAPRPIEISSLDCSREEGIYAEKFFSLRGSKDLGLVTMETSVDAAVLPMLEKMLGGKTGAREAMRLILQGGDDLSKKQGYHQSKKEIARQWQLVAGAERNKFELIGEGKSLGFLTVPEVLGKTDSAELITAGKKSYQCRFKEKLLDDHIDEQYAAVLAEWNAFKKHQPKVCDDTRHDSQEIIQLERPKATVLLLQGYAESPAYMASLADFFGKQGFNVLTPRLKGHFDKNPRDLDSVKGEEWTKETEEAFKIAAKMSPKVIVAGYSLGGLLGARLALKYPQQIGGMIGFSPAFRLTTKSSALSSIGSLFGLSANDALGGTVASCHIYISSNGGLEVGRVVSDTEQRFGGSESAFSKLKVPSLVFNVADDDTVDAAGVASAFSPNSKKRTLVSLVNGNHDSWGSEEWLTLKTASGKGVASQMQDFLKKLDLK
ncbi:MAG: alpha/beta hydrolase, partial [Bdellovibrionota bacterium]